MPFRSPVRLLTSDEGGWVSPKQNGVRPSFRYTGDTGGHWMIWPTFLDESGHARSGNLPVDEWIPTRMFILDPKLRLSIHANRLRIGTEFEMFESTTKIAEGVVTKLSTALTTAEAQSHEAT